MKLRPLADRVIVKPTEGASKSPGGILIPEQAKEKPTTGTVVAVGSGRVLDNGQVLKAPVKKGDLVLYGKYAGIEIEDGLRVISQTEILAVIE